MEWDEGQKYFGDYPRWCVTFAPVSMRHGLSSRNPGYYQNPGNYNWVTKEVNRMRREYTIDRYVEICIQVAKNQLKGDYNENLG